METGFWKCNDPKTSTHEWFALNFNMIDTEAVRILAQLDGCGGLEALELLTYDECDECEGEGEISCEHCNGDGTIYHDDGEIEELCGECGGDPVERCRACDGQGQKDPYESMLAWPVGWGTMFTCKDHDVTIELLGKAGATVYRPQGDMPISGIVFGIDGCGYSFYGAHWIPLRASMAIHCSRLEHSERLTATLKMLEEEAEREGDGDRFRRRFGEHYIKENHGDDTSAPAE